MTREREREREREGGREGGRERDWERDVEPQGPFDPSVCSLHPMHHNNSPLLHIVFYL